MKITEEAVNRPITVLVFVALLTGVAVLSLFRLPITFLPSQFEVPVLVVQTSYPGSLAEEVEREVSKPLEQALSGIKGLKEIQSRSLDGFSSITLELKSSSDIQETISEARDLIDLVLSELPEEAGIPAVLRIDIEDYLEKEILFVLLKGEGRTPQTLAQLLERRIIPRLDRLPGVVVSKQRLPSKGSEIWITARPSKLAFRGLTLRDVESVIRGANFEILGQRLQEGKARRGLKITSRLRNPQDIQKFPVVVAKGNSLPLGEVATVSTVADSFGERETGSTFTIFLDDGSDSTTFLDGKRIFSSGLRIGKESGESTITVSNRVLREIDSLNRELPHGVKLEVINDTAAELRQSLGKVIYGALWGIVLTVTVLGIFLRRFLATLAVAVSIPLSILSVILWLFLRGQELSLFGMFGLLLGIGMVVDSSIVVLENIFRYHEKGIRGRPAAILGTKEVSMPIVASTLTSVCVFVPLLINFNDGGSLQAVMMGLFSPFALVLLSSLFLALTLVPAFCGSFLKVADRKEITPSLWRRLGVFVDRGLVLFEKRYRKWLGVTLRHKGWTIVAIILGSAGVITASIFFGVDRNESKSQTEKESTSLSFTLSAPLFSDKIPDVVEEIHRIFAEEMGTTTHLTVHMYKKEAFGTFSALSEGGHLGEKNRHLLKKKLLQLKGTTPGIKLSIKEEKNQNFQFSGEGKLEEKKISVQVASEDVEASLIAGSRIIDYLEKRFPEFSDFRLENATGRKIKNPNRLLFTMIPEIAERVSWGKSLQKQLDEIVDTGKRATVSYEEGDQTHKIYVASLLRGESLSKGELESLEFRDREGISLPLKNFFTVKKDQTSPGGISRVNRKRAIKVVGDLKDGVDAKSLRARVFQSIQKEMILPDHVSLPDLRKKEQDSGLVMVIRVLVMAVILVYGIMASQFESLRAPLIIFLVLPSLFVGILLIHLMFRLSVGAATGVGMVVLIGVAVNTGIVLVDYTNLLMKRGSPTLEMACLEAGAHRLRPVLMTTSTTILGILPMVLFVQNTFIKQMGITVIGGMISSTLCTLFLVPVLCALFYRKRFRKMHKV